MTINFLSLAKKEDVGEKRYYISQFDSDTYQIIDSVEKREICTCSNYDDWEDAKERAQNIVNLLNNSNHKTRD